MGDGMNQLNVELPCFPFANHPDLAETKRERRPTTQILSWNMTIFFHRRRLWASALLVSFTRTVHCFHPSYATCFKLLPQSSRSSLFVSVGLGPEEHTLPRHEESSSIDILEPDHELYRTSRLSDFDKTCDEWFGTLVGGKEDPHFLGEVSQYSEQRLHTLVELKDEPIYSDDDPNWTPYTQRRLRGSPILPAYGLEQYGLPIPRRNAEAWRQFDVAGLVATDYSKVPLEYGSELLLDNHAAEQLKSKLIKSSVWLENDACTGRLVYINGRFVPALSKISECTVNLGHSDFTSPNDVPNHVLQKLKRLTDGFTDDLAVGVPVGKSFLTSYKSLSAPDHSIGEPTNQFAINGQQGTACFAALNSLRTGAVALVNIPRETNLTKPVLILNIERDEVDTDHPMTDNVGFAFHPRSLILAGENSHVSVIQSYITLDSASPTICRPKLLNGYTQIFIESGAAVEHSYLEETGGMVTAGVEGGDDDTDNKDAARLLESKRKALRDTHFETIDVHIAGDNGSYKGTLLTFGGKGRSRIATSISLLRPQAHATIHGFSLAGGAQRTDFRTFIHHIAQGTSSSQVQKNMIGGRASTTFRGKIRVEKSAQKTDSEQLARSILLSDKARVWAIPSLEIIADDVKCSHGATISDLAEEELFYLQSRGVDKITARNMLMYAFVEDVASSIDESIIGSKDDPSSLKNRITKRLEALVPRGARAIQGEFQSV